MRNKTESKFAGRALLVCLLGQFEAANTNAHQLCATVRDGARRNPLTRPR
jgi:hypothetical protein